MVASPAAVVAETNWYAQELTATGDGAPPAHATSQAQRRLLTKRAAETEARRNLAEKLAGVHVSSQTTVRDFMTESDVIRSHCNAFIRGAQVVDERENADGTYTVTISLDLRSLREVIRPQAAPAPPRRAAPVGGGRGKAMAMRAATLDAQRKLVEKIYGTYVQSETSVTNFELDYDRILSQASGLLRWAEETDQRYDPGSGEAQVTLRLDGANVKRMVRMIRKRRGY